MKTKEISFTIYGHTYEVNACHFLMANDIKFTEQNVFSNFHGTKFTVTPKDQKQYDLVWDRFMKL
jgi:hypothetical protein